jgi:hypothetical protein
MGLLKIEPALMLLLGLHIVEIKENRSPVEVPPIRLRVTLLANLVSEQAVQLRKRTSTSSTTPANAQNETSSAIHRQCPCRIYYQKALGHQPE